MITKEGYDRIDFLRNAVNEGEDAKIVLTVVEKYLDKLGKDTLTILAEETDKEKLADAISDYKAVVRFCNAMKQAVSFGERKEEALTKELHQYNTRRK